MARAHQERRHTFVAHRHVEDTTRAGLAASSAPRERIHTQAFNVGRSGENHRIRHIAEIVRQMLTGCRADYTPGADPNKCSCCACHVDFARLMPRSTVPRRAQQMSEACPRACLSPEECEDPRCDQIDLITHLLGPDQVYSTLRRRRAVTT
jgi:hypothetical protein